MSEEYHVPDLGRLIGLMDVVVREQAGEKVSETLAAVRRLSAQRRTGLPGTEDRLTETLASLSDDVAREVMRSLSLFFDLANLAEDRQRVRKLRERADEARRENRPRTESVASAVAEWSEAGYTADDVQRRLNRLSVEPVFTAHPSEAKRRTTREMLRKLRTDLAGGAEDRLLLSDLTALWQSDLVRPQRPSVQMEVDRGLFFARVLWDVVPRVYGELRAALKKYYPGHQFTIPAFLRFGTWIGGDRDGHPDVTHEVTRETLAVLRREAISAHRAKCQTLMGILVSSCQQTGVTEPIASLIKERVEEWPGLSDRLSDLSPHEHPRHWLRQIEFRLNATAGVAGTPSEAAYASADGLIEDIDVLRRQHEAAGGQRLVEDFIRPWLDQAAVFGLHFAAMDVRQDSAAHKVALEEVLTAAGISIPKDEAALIKLLAADPPEAIETEKTSDATKEILAVFEMLVAEVRRGGLRSLGVYIISMTHRVSDVLTVLWFWRRAWAASGAEGPAPNLPIAPLLETIDDLAAGPELLDDLLKCGSYRGVIEPSDGGRPAQMVMVGYSDSTKDGGYLAAVWRLHRAQERLAEVADRHGVRLTVFHGRGGALGRGGGPAARAIQSLPPKAVRGRVRVTEQGEVLAERYDDPEIAHRHLEQITHATLRVSGDGESETPGEWTVAMETMTAASLKKYRQLVEHEHFLAYFDQATPIGEIESLPIGSRPARRRERRSLSDLRAIPWTFAWTQSRHLLPAWFGLGTGLSTFAESEGGSFGTLQEMYQRWPMFTALVDNADLALAKADMEIAARYAALAGDDGSEVWQMIADEFQRSRAAVLLTTGEHDLLAETGWLRKSIRARNPAVDPLNMAQIMLLKRKRAAAPDSEEAEAASELVRLAIQGVAAGLRSTG